MICTKRNDMHIYCNAQVLRLILLAFHSHYSPAEVWRYFFVGVSLSLLSVFCSEVKLAVIL